VSVAMTRLSSGSKGRWSCPVNIGRRLAETRPDAFLSNVAVSLNHVGMMVSNLRRYEKALAATRGAVNIRRRLAET
jgi:hypothetical protein